MISKLLFLCLLIGVSQACDDLVQCLMNPCQVTTCPKYPTAKCVADYCGGCNAKFYLQGKQITDCDLPTRSCSEISDMKTCHLRDGCVWYSGSCSDGDDSVMTLQACSHYDTESDCEKDVYCDFDSLTRTCKVASPELRTVNVARAVKSSLDSVQTLSATSYAATTTSVPYTTTDATSSKPYSDAAAKKLKVASSILSLDSAFDLLSVCKLLDSSSCRLVEGCTNVYDKCVPNILEFCAAQDPDMCDLSDLCTEDTTACEPTTDACALPDDLSDKETASLCRKIIGCTVMRDSEGVSCVPQPVVGDTVQCIGLSPSYCDVDPHCWFDFETWQCLPEITSLTVECSSIYDHDKCAHIPGCVWSHFNQSCVTDTIVTSSECSFLGENACNSNTNCFWHKYMCNLREITALDNPCDFGYDVELCKKAHGCTVDPDTYQCVVDAADVNVCTGLLPSQCGLFPTTCHVDAHLARCVAGVPVDCTTLSESECRDEPSCIVDGTSCVARPIIERNICTGLPKEACVHADEFCSFFNYECVPIEVEVAALCSDIDNAALCETTLGCVFDEHQGKHGKCLSELNVYTDCYSLHGLKCVTSKQCELHSGKCVQKADFSPTCRGLDYTDCSTNDYCYHNGRYCEDLNVVASLCFGLNEKSCTVPELQDICVFEHYRCVERNLNVTLINGYDDHYHSDDATPVPTQQVTSANVVRTTVREPISVPARSTAQPPATRVVTVVTDQQDFCTIYDMFECRNNNLCSWIGGTTGCVSSRRLVSNNKCRIFTRFECSQQQSSGCYWKESSQGNFVGECMQLNSLSGMTVQHIEKVSNPVQTTYPSSSSSSSTPVQSSSPVQQATPSSAASSSSAVQHTVDVQVRLEDLLARVQKAATHSKATVVKEKIVAPTVVATSYTKNNSYGYQDPSDYLYHKKDNATSSELLKLLDEFSSLKDFSKNALAEADLARLEAAIAQQKAHLASQSAQAAATAAQLTYDHDASADVSAKFEQAALLEEKAAHAELESGLYGSLAHLASAYGIFGKGLTTVEEILTFGYLTHARIQCSSFTYEFCLQNNYQCVYNPKTFLCYDRGSAAASVASECALYERSKCLLHTDNCIWDHSSYQCLDASVEYQNSEDCMYYTNSVDCADAVYSCRWDNDFGLCVPRTPVPAAKFKRVTVTNHHLIPTPCKSQVKIDFFMEGKVYKGSIYTEMDYFRKADVQFRARAAAFFLEHYGVDFATADYYRGLQLVPFKVSDELFAQVIDYNFGVGDVVIPKRNRILIDGFQVITREKHAGVISGNYAQTLGVKSAFLGHDEFLTYMEFRVVDEYGGIYHQFGVSTMYPLEREEKLGVLPSVSVARHAEWGTGVLRSVEKSKVAGQFSSIRLAGIFFFGECSTVNEAYKKTLDALDYAATEARLLATASSFLGLRASPAVTSVASVPSKDSSKQGEAPPMPIMDKTPEQGQAPPQQQYPQQQQVPPQGQNPQSQYPSQQYPQQQQQYPQQQQQQYGQVPTQGQNSQAQYPTQQQQYPQQQYGQMPAQGQNSQAQYPSPQQQYDPYTQFQSAQY